MGGVVADDDFELDAGQADLAGGVEGGAHEAAAEALAAVVGGDADRADPAARGTQAEQGEADRLVAVAGDPRAVEGDVVLVEEGAQVGFGHVDRDDVTGIAGVEERGQGGQAEAGRRFEADGHGGCCSIVMGAAEGRGGDGYAGR